MVEQTQAVPIKVEGELYNKVVDVTTGYLGPAAEKFITRQIQAHLGKNPSELTKEDIAKLTDWVKVAIAILTEDAKMVDDFTKALLELAETKPSNN